MLPFENAKLLPKSKVFEEQVASRTKEAGEVSHEEIGARANGAVAGPPDRNIQDVPDAGESWTPRLAWHKRKEGAYESPDRAAHPRRLRCPGDPRADPDPARVPGHPPRRVSRDETARRR